jgi:hypothetical protein
MPQLRRAIGPCPARAATDTLSDMAGYDDGRVACTDDEIILRRYYMWRDRHISYRAIREARQVPNRWKNREHGSGDFVYWLNSDPHRKHKDRALILYILADKNKVSALQAPGDPDERVKPVVTPDDLDGVVAELTAHGVNVTSGQADSDD